MDETMYATAPKIKWGTPPTGLLTRDWSPDSICAICHELIADWGEWASLPNRQTVHQHCYNAKRINELTAERNALAARVKELEQPERRCAKCGGIETWVRWHQRAIDCASDEHNSHREFSGEHLHVHCTCGYEWSTPPLDTKGDT